MNTLGECLGVEVARHLTATDVIKVLDRLFKEHGAPAFLRSDFKGKNEHHGKITRVGVTCTFSGEIPIKF